MTTKSEKPQTAKLKRAKLMCQLAIADCDALLMRTGEMLRRSGQDNDRPYSD